MVRHAQETELLHADERQDLLAAEAPWLHALTISVLDELSRDSSFPVSDRWIQEYTRDRVFAEDLIALEPIGAYVQSESPNNIEAAQLVATLCMHAVNHKIIHGTQHGNKEERFVGGIESAARTIGYLTLTAYICAQYDLAGQDALESFEGVSFTELSTMYAATDFIELNQRLLKTAQIMVDPNTFSMHPEGIVQIGAIFDKPHFNGLWRELVGDVPVFYPTTICTKNEQGRIVFTPEFEKFLRDFMLVTNRARKQEQVDNIEPDQRLERAGTIGCPLGHINGRFDASRYSPEELDLIEQHLDTTHRRFRVAERNRFVRNYLGLLALQFGSLGQKYEGVEDFKIFALIR